MLSNRYILVLLLFCLSGIPPKRSVAVDLQDSLGKYSFRQLDDLIYENRRDSLKVLDYVDYSLKKAQFDNNYEEIIHFYANYVFYQKVEDRLRFIDSALNYAHRYGDKELIGDVYLWKATVYYSLKDYESTLTYYLKANEYISQTNNTYSKYQIKNFIAALKNYMGYHDEAEVLFKECVAYFGANEKSRNAQRGLVSSLQGLSWSYTKTGRLSESNQLITKALQSARRAGFSELDTHYPVFKLGINDYYLGEYGSAISRIEQKLPFIYENEDFAWAVIGEFYLGKCYWDQGDKEKAIAYFEKVEEIFQAKNYTHPDLREAYELLINYYKEKGNKERQLHYVEQLVMVDSVYHQNHKHLIGRIHQEYTTKDLLATKKQLERALYLEKNKTMLITTVSILAISLVLGFAYYRQRKAKRAAQELIQKMKRLQAERAQFVNQRHQEGEVSAQVKSNEERSFSSPLERGENQADDVSIPEKIKADRSSSLQLNDAVVEKLLHKLTKFEQKNKFLQQNITLEKLANTFGTNTTYLSSVINKHKGKTFSEYLNSLRLEYLLNEMVANPDSIFFKYSFQSIAEHLGYSSATTFSRAFQTHTGVKPSVFIKELQNEQVAV